MPLFSGILGGVLGGVGQVGAVMEQQRQDALKREQLAQAMEVERMKLAQQESEFSRTQQAQEAQKTLPRAFFGADLPSSIGEDVQQIPVTALPYLLGRAKMEQEQATQGRISAAIQGAQGSPGAPMPAEAAMYSPQADIPARAPMPTSDLVRALMGMGPEGMKAAQAFQKEARPMISVASGANVFDPNTGTWNLGPPADVKPKTTTMRVPTAEGEMLVTVDEQGQPVGQPIRVGSISHPPVERIPPQPNPTAQLIELGFRKAALEAAGKTDSPEYKGIVSAINVAKPGGQASYQQQKDEADMLAHRQLLDDVGNLYQPQWVGPGRAAAAKISKYIPFMSGTGQLPGTSGPEAEFDKSLEQAQAYLNQDFAKRFGIQELNRMLQIMPNKNQPPAVFESAMKATKRELDTIYSARQAARPGAPPGIPTPGPAPAVPRADPLQILR